MGGSINLANVALGFDASKLQRGVGISAGEMRKLGSIFKDSISPLDKYKQQLEILDKAFNQGAITKDRYGQIQESLARKHGIVTQAMRMEAIEAENLKRRTEELKRSTEEFNAAKKRGEDLSRQAMTSNERNAASIRAYQNDLKNGIISKQTYHRLVTQVNDSHSQQVTGVKSLTREMQGMALQYASAGVAIGLVKKSMSLAAEAEQNKAAFEVLAGSAGKAEMLLKNFIKLDAESTLSRGDFSRAAKTMMGFGVDVDLVSSRMSNLGQIAMGDAQRFQSLALAFGQVTASGRLMGQEVLQMVNAGFNPLQQISESTGRSMTDLRGAMERGEISVRMVADAFDAATEKGGRFFGMNEKMLNTAAGQYAKLVSQITQAGTEIGNNLLPAAVALMNVLNGGDSGSGGGILNRFAEGFGFGVEGLAALAQGDSEGGIAARNKLRDRIDAKAGREAAEAQLAIHVPSAEEQKRINQMAVDRQEKKLAEQRIMEDTLGHQKRMEEERGKRIEAQWAQTNKDIEDRNKERDEAEKALETEKDQRAKQMDQLDKQRNGFLKDKDRISDDAVNGFKTIAPALKAGSVEAYKFMLNQKDKAAEIAERALEINGRIKDIQEQQLELLKQQPKLARKA